MKGCLVEGCDRRHHARGFCAGHYGRARTGDTRAVLPKPEGRPPRGGIPGYDAAHRRILRSLGPATGFACVECGCPASEWSYSGGDPDELTNRPDLRREHPGLTYSLDPSFYAPRCRPCHRRMDKSLIQARDPISGRFVSVSPLPPFSA